jgi:hypothetical protein
MEPKSYGDITTKRWLVTIVAFPVSNIVPLLGLLDETVDARKLPRPLCVVQELAQIKSIIIWGVTFCVIRWSDSAHLVTIHRIVNKEALDLFSDHARCEMIPRYTKLSKPVRLSRHVEQQCDKNTVRYGKSNQLTWILVRIVKSFEGCRTNRVRNSSCPYHLHPIASAHCRDYFLQQ